MSEIQSVLFNKDKWTLTKARKWLKEHNLKPINRVFTTNDKYRYMINQSFKYKKLRTKKTGENLSIVIGFL